MKEVGTYNFTSGYFPGQEGLSPVLNESQVNRVWESLLAAEARSLYFADLASRYTARKQIITGCSFFLSSGAAAAVIAKAPDFVPVMLSLIAAASTAYSIAVGLDRKAATMVKLHSSWKQIATDYNRLWNHAFDDDAENVMDRIIESEREPSELATTEAPNNQKLLGEWQERVFGLYHVADQNG